MNWTTHQPKFDGDVPDGVTLDTHWIEFNVADIWFPVPPFYEPAWAKDTAHRYRPRMEDIQE